MCTQELQTTKINFINNVYCQNCILILMDQNKKIKTDYTHYHFLMQVSWIYDKSGVTDTIIKSVPRFRKSYWNKSLYLFFVRGTFCSNKGVGKIMGKGASYTCFSLYHDKKYVPVMENTINNNQKIQGAS